MSWFGKNAVWFCHVLLLDESEHPVEIRKKTNGEEVLEKVFQHLNLLERDYFGLRYIDRDSQSRWLDPLKPVVKQLKAGPPYLLYFCVKFYAADPCRLHEELTRYLFFLQVKKDIYQGRLPCATNVLAELSSYSIQSELGEYDPKEHTQGYVSEFRFIPNQSEELEAKVGHMHKKLGQMVPSVAEFMYLDKVKWLEMYGVDLHPAKGDDFVEYFVALKPSGLAVYRNKTRVGSYLWSKIEKVDFKGKKFYLTVKGKEDRESTFKFYLPTNSACKHLWKCCLEHHIFFRLDKSKTVPRRRKSILFRTSSSYRYSGRTQKEALEDGKKIKRSDPEVSRTKTDGDPSSRNGANTAVDGSDNPGPALPWEQSAQLQGGLYTPAPDSPHSMKSTGSGRVKRSPKFPRGRKAYSSDDDTGRRRRRRCQTQRRITGMKTQTGKNEEAARKGRIIIIIIGTGIVKPMPEAMAQHRSSGTVKPPVKTPNRKRILVSFNNLKNSFASFEESRRGFYLWLFLLLLLSTCAGLDLIFSHGKIISGCLKIYVSFAFALFFFS
ncbi:Band 4.1-like protein 4 [Acropora cervicornis]|uniref:Band 4.1-like protein 4 n=1 Tax=Acropora cervicornis TaxID=6130 RepID=A0AAD9QV49_ACRCE|nr:Band 4.1-like protein 4 [Acropora cervicornis]